MSRDVAQYSAALTPPSFHDAGKLQQLPCLIRHQFLIMASNTANPDHLVRQWPSRIYGLIACLPVYRDRRALERRGFV